MRRLTQGLEPGATTSAITLRGWNVGIASSVYANRQAGGHRSMRALGGSSRSIRALSGPNRSIRDLRGTQRSN